jgi:glycosyltransferase involved in cell wall biosynthesis
MKLLYAIKSLDHTSGGAERVLVDVTDDLAQKGHQVSVLTFDKPGGRSFYPLNTNIKRISLGIGRADRKSTLGETLQRIWRMRQEIKKEKPDAVVAFMHSMFIPMALGLCGTGIPVIASEHIVPEHYKKRKFEFLLFLVSSLFVKRFTVISEKVRSLYPAYLRERMDVMPNPLSTGKTKETQHEAARPRKVILNVGRLDPQKDQKALIEAFAELAPHFPDWDLRIIGEGALRKELEELVKIYGLQNRVFLPGVTQKIDQEYEHADIFAISSRYESFGMATAEALSHGLPAVGFADCPGTNEVIHSGVNGLLVDGRDRVGELAKGLRSLMQNPALRVRMGLQGQKSVSHFSSERVYQNWENLLSKVSETGSRPHGRRMRIGQTANQNKTTIVLPDSASSKSSASPLRK